MIKILEYMIIWNLNKDLWMDEYITQTRISHARSCIKKHGLKEPINLTEPPAIIITKKPKSLMAQYHCYYPTTKTT